MREKGKANERNKLIHFFALLPVFILELLLKIHFSPRCIDLNCFSTLKVISTERKKMMKKPDASPLLRLIDFCSGIYPSY
jgi:hypothetical protein